jgi:2-phosphoglycerate kinase
VLLIAGSSGTGKSIAAQSIARQRGGSVLMADDVRIALQAVTTPDVFPSLHTFLAPGNKAYESAEKFRDGLIRVGEAVAPALLAIISHHLVVIDAGVVIIEGDAILPRLVLPLSKQLRAVCVVEADAERLLANLRTRERGFPQMPIGRQKAIAKGSEYYGRHLAAEAARMHWPVVASRPFESLAARIVDAAKGTA